MKGIVLAGGRGTRLYPLTIGPLSKQLLPVYDKPMIFYPISVLMLAGIKEILVITTPEHSDLYKSLLGDGSNFNISINYEIQDEPKGIADAFKIGANFIGNDPVALILGDNIFYGGSFSKLLRQAKSKVDLNNEAVLFSYRVNNPKNFGVVEFLGDQVISLEEKPDDPKSNFALTGLYFYPNDVVTLVNQLSPSERGELEITDLNKIYLSLQRLSVIKLSRGFAWLDTGTHQSLLDASNFIQTIETRQGLKIACLEEIAWRMKFITKQRLLELAQNYNNDYGSYLIKIASKDE